MEQVPQLFKRHYDFHWSTHCYDCCHIW